MSTSHIRSIRVGVESVFGNPATGTGLPSTNGIALRLLECERASLETFGDFPMNEREEARDGPHFLPPEPDTIWASAARVQKRTGTISLTCPLRPLGTGANGTSTSATISLYSDLPLFHLLNSGMWAAATPAASTLTAATNSQAAAAVNVGGDSINAQTGSLVCAARNGAFEVSSVMQVSGATLTLSPALSGTLATNTVIRSMKTLYTDRNLAHASLGYSVALVIDGVGWRTIAQGCRMESFSLSFRGHQAMLEITMQSPYIKDDHSNASVGEPIRTNAAPVHLLNSYVVLSGAATDPVTVGTALSRGTVPVDEVALSYNNTLTPRGFSDNVLGMSDLEVTNVEVECNLTLSVPSNSLGVDFQNQVQRSVLIGLAGSLTSASAVTAGNGAAVYIPAGTLMVDATKRDLGSDLVRQVLTYKQGRFQGDALSTNASNSPFRLGLGL